MKHFKNLLLTAAVLSVACASQSCASAKLRRITRNDVNPSLTLPSEKELERYGGESRQQKADGDGLYAMKTCTDKDTGETMGSEDLDPAVIVARFRNTAERRGKVNFDFMIIAKDSLQDPSWQIRFHPVVYYSKTDTLALPPVYLTGADFRNAQLKAVRRYDAYLKRLSRDSLHFVDRSQTSAFVERFPDTAVDKAKIDRHFARPWLVKVNAKRVALKDKVRDKMIAVPLSGEEVRRDSVSSGTGNFVYLYRQSIPSGRNTKKFELRVRSEIVDGNGKAHALKQTDPITFYISSLSSLVDESISESRKSDSLYTKGLLLLSERRWEEALAILAPYEDYHSALAYIALEYNATAADILKKLPETPLGDYLLALSYSRRGLEDEATASLTKAVELQPSLRYRANLDPEIAALTARNHLFENDSEE